MYISDVEKKVPNTLFDTIKVSLYKTLKGKEQIGKISLTELFKRIKDTPYADPEDYEWARQDEQGLIKLKESLPCFTPHGVFHPGQKANDKIKHFTGLVFIDVDFKKTTLSSQDIKSSLFGQSEIIACWQSLSGCGVHALAVCDNVPETPAQFNEAVLNYLDALAQTTGIDSSLFDKKLANPQAGCVIAYDPDLLLKGEFTPYFLNRQKKSGSENIDTQEEVFLLPDFFRDTTDLRFESEIESYPQYIPEGRPFFRCYLPFHKETGSRMIPSGSRNLVLSTFLHNLVCLSPNSPEGDFTAFMQQINQDYCVTPLSRQEIKKMVINKLRRRSTLKPKEVRLKKWWTDPRSLTRKADYNALRKKVAKEKLDKLQEFFALLPNYPHKITASFITKECGIGKTTLFQMLSPDMKHSLNLHNAQYTYTRKRNKTPQK